MQNELSSDHYQQAELAERGVLGAAILQPSTLDEVSELVTGQCFHDRALGRTFDLLVDLHFSGQSIADATRLRAELQAAGILEDIGGAAFIAKLVSESFAHNALWYAHQIDHLHRQRKLHAAAVEAVQACVKNEDPAEVAKLLDARLLAVQAKETDECSPVGQTLHEAVRTIQANRKTGKSLGLPTGIAKLDEAIGGFQRGELTILAARPSIGKTALALEIAARVAQRNRNVLIASLEMTREQLAYRLISRDTGIPVTDLIECQELSPADEAEIIEARHRMNDWPLRIWSPGGASIQAIRAKARIEIAQRGMDLLILDYLGLVRESGNQYERVTRIATSLQHLAKDLDRPVLALSQLNRGSEKEQRRPRLSDLRDSGAIEENANNVLLLHREDRKSETAEVNIAKQRQGATGSILLDFDPVRMAFDSGPIAKVWQPQ